MRNNLKIQLDIILFRASVEKNIKDRLYIFSLLQPFKNINTNTMFTLKIVHNGLCLYFANLPFKVLIYLLSAFSFCNPIKTCFILSPNTSL